ncbi:MAG: ATP-binding protein, partial [Myxococcota bacterium]|nr:ATP-binding protein [Myxococcota bacterium]
MDPADDSTFRLLVEQSPDGHFILVDGVFTYLNAAATEMFGWGDLPPDNLKALDVIDPSDHERLQRNMLLRQSGALRGANSYLGVRKDGSNFPIEVHTAPLGSGSGVALHGVVRDVSDREKLEDVLVRSEQDGLLARLASGTAHDFNNLLAVIQSNAEVIQRGEDKEQADAALKRILAAVRRGEQKVTQMQRLRAGPGLTGKPMSTHLNSLVEEVLELTRPRWRDEADLQGVRYEICWEPGEPPAVVASPSDLRAALVALVFNAVEAMPQGGVLTLRTGAHGKDLASISIHDSGEGLETTDLEALSDVFYTTRPDRSVGLGLHLVRRVVSRQGGRLKVESTVGEGSTFTVLLSASPADPEQPAP